MTDHGPSIDPRQIAGHSLGLAQAAVERRETKAADTRALLSIAASLLLITDHLDQRPAAPETLTVLPEVERVAGGCCCHRDDDTDDLLEFAFGIICSAEHAVTSDGHIKTEWQQATRRFIDAYNAKITTAAFGGSLEDQLIRAKAHLEDLKAAMLTEQAVPDGRTH